MLGTKAAPYPGPRAACLPNAELDTLELAMLIGVANYDIVHVFRCLKPDLHDSLARNPLIKVEEVSKRQRSNAILIEESGLRRSSTRLRHA